MRGWNLLSGPVNMPSQVKAIYMPSQVKGIIYMLTHKVTAEKIGCIAEAVQVKFDGTFQFSTYYIFSHT